MKEDGREPTRSEAEALEDGARYEAWARSAAIALTMRPAAIEAPLERLEDMLLEQLAPIAGGELQGAPAYLEGSLPSRLWRAVSSLAYGLFLPVWPRPANEDRPLVGGEERPDGLILRIYHGPPTYDRSFVLCDAVEELACTDRAGLRHLWRKLEASIPQTPPDDG